MAALETYPGTKERMPEQQPPEEPLPWLLAIRKYQRIVHSARVKWAHSVCRAPRITERRHPAGLWLQL